MAASSYLPTSIAASLNAGGGGGGARLSPPRRTRTSARAANLRAIANSGSSRSSAGREPLVYRGSGGGGADEPASLFGQLTRMAKGIPAGIGQLVKTGGQSLATLGRLPIDAATGRLSEKLEEAGGSWSQQSTYNQEMLTPQLRDFMVSQGINPDEKHGGFREFAREYTPLATGMTESIAEGTAPRLWDLAHGDIDEYKQASKEGHILDTLVEDIGNIAILGGPASKAIGRTSKTVSVPNIAAREAIEGGARLRSVGAAVADDLAVADTIIPPRMPRPVAITEGGKVIPMETTATIKGTGLAGMVERRALAGGAETSLAAERIAKVGRGVGLAARLGDEISDAGFAWPARGIAAAYRKTGLKKALTTTSETLIRNTAEGTGNFARIAERFTPEARAAARETRAVEATLDRELTAGERSLLESRKIEQRYKLTPAEARAALFDVDQRFIPIVRAYSDMTRQGLDADVVMADVLERSYEGLPDALRPTVDDVRAYIDWQGGQLDDVKSAAMHQVAEAVTEGSNIRTQQLQSIDALNPEQLGDTYLTDKVRSIEGKLETKLDRTMNERYDKSRKAVRAQRYADVNEAMNEPPPPPDPKTLVETGRKGGIAEARATVARRDLRTAQTGLRQAWREYEAAEKGTAEGPVLDRLADEIDRKVAQVETLKENIRLLGRKRGATEAFTRVEDRLVSEAQNIPRPEPATTPHTASAIKAGAKEIRDQYSTEAWEAFDGLTGGVRLRTPTDATKGGGEWDWWQRLGQSQKATLVRERLLVSRYEGGGKGKRKTGTQQEGVTPDQLAQLMSDRLGRQLDVDEAVDMYLASADNYLSSRRAGDDISVNQVAEQLGLPVEAARVALSGSAADFKSVMRDYAVAALDEMQTAFAEADPDMSAALLTELDQMRKGGAPPEVLGDFIEESLGAVDADVRGILEPIWGRVPIEDIADWLSGKEISPAIYETVIGPRSAVNQRIVDRMGQQLIDMRSGVAGVVYDRKRMETIYGDAQRASQADARRAGRKLDKAASTEQRAAVASEEVNAQADQVAADVKAARKSGGVWQRHSGSVLNLSTGERVTTRPVSRAEVTIARHGALRDRAAAHAAVVKRLDRSAARYNERIAGLETELGRGFVERLVTDINQPAVNSVKSTLRGVENPMGQVIEGIDGTPQLTGVMGKLANKYGISDEAIIALETEAGRAAGDMQPLNSRRAFQAALDEAGIEMSEADRLLIDRSMNVDQLMHEIGMIEAEDMANGTAAATPYRVQAHIHSQSMERMVPSDIVSQIEKRMVQYETRRANHLMRMYDDYTSVMPARYRAVSMQGRRLVRGLLDEAEKFRQAGDSYSSSALMGMAEDVPTTMQAMIDAGIDPTHLTGGEGPTGGTGGKGGGVRKRKLAATEVLQEGLRPVSLEGVVRLEVSEANKLITNRSYDFLVDKVGQLARDVVPEVIAEWRMRHPGDLVIPERELRAALDEAGWAAPPGDRSAIHGGTKVVPKSIVRSLAEQRYEPGLMWQGLRAVNRAFKTTVLPFSPKWHIGNAIGNAFMAMVHGGMSPLELARTLDEVAQKQGGWIEYYRSGEMPAWAPDELATHGFTHNEQQLRWGSEDLRGVVDDEAPGRVREMFNGFVAGSYNLNGFVDNATRSAVYLSGLRKGMSPEQAMKHTLRALGDFTNMTPFERRYIREVFPFYSWLRHQTQAALRLPLYHPSRAVVLAHLTNMVNDPEYGGDLLAQLGAKGIKVGGGYTLPLGGISPFANPFDLPLDPTGPGFLRGLSPGIDVPIQAVTGQTVTALGPRPVSRPSDQDVTDIYGRTTPRSPLRRLFRGDVTGALGEIGYNAAGTVGPTRAIRDLALDAFSGDLGDFRYQSGDRGPAEYSRPRSIAQTVAGGLNIPYPEKVDVDKIRRELARQRGR